MSRHLINKKSPIILIILILSIGAIFRIYSLGFGLPDDQYIFTYSSDENQYMRSLSQMNPRDLNFNPHYFNWGTWHFYELGGILTMAKAFGLVSLNQSKDFYHEYPHEYAKIVLTGRVLSVVYSLAAILLVFYIGKKIFSEKVGLMSALLLSLSPAHIMYSILLKADAAVTFWLLLLLWFSLNILLYGERKYYYLAGVSAGFALGTQWTAVPLLHIIYTANLARNMKTLSLKEWIRNSFSKNVILGYLTMTLVYMIICPYSWLSFKEFVGGVNKIILGRGGGIHAMFISNYLFDPIYVFSIGITYPILILIIFAIIYSLFNIKNKSILVILLFVLPMTCLIVSKGYLMMRYYMVLLPPFFLLVSFSIFSSLEKMDKIKFLSSASKVLMTIILCYCFIYSAGVSAILKRNERVQNIASDWIKDHIPDNSRIGILTSPEIRFVPTIIHNNFYYSKDDMLNRNKPYYHIFSINDDVNVLNREKPVYFILSNLQNFKFELPNFMSPNNNSAAVREQLQKDYKVEKKFSTDLTVKIFNEVTFDYSGLRLPAGFEEFVPTIYILKKKS